MYVKLAQTLRWGQHNIQHRDRAVTVRVKALPCRLTASNKFSGRWPNQGNHKSEVPERVVTASRVKYVAKQVLAFE